MDRSAYALGLFLMVALVGVATWIGVEVNWWRRGRQVISRGQFIARMVNAGIVVWLLLLVGVGKFVVKWDNPRAEVLYWAGILLMVLLVAGFAVCDWRRVMAVREEKEKEIYRELVQSLKTNLSAGGEDHTREDSGERS